MDVDNNRVGLNGGLGAGFALSIGSILAAYCGFWRLFNLEMKQPLVQS